MKFDIVVCPPLLMILSSILTIALSMEPDINCSESSAQNILAIMQSHNANKLTLNELYCARDYIETSTAACSLLCYHYLSYGNVISSYRYALRSLENVPHYIDAVACLAATYYATGNYIRAAYYAELVHITSPSLTIPVDGVKRPLFLYLSEQMPAVVRPVAPPSSPPSVPTYTQHILHRISHMLNGTMSLLSVHKALQTELSVLHRGPSIVATEEFLEQIEAALNPQTHTQGLDEISYRNRHPEDVIYDIRYEPFLDGDIVASVGQDGQDLCVRWPADKFVKIYSFIGTSRTFGETLVGLSDAFDKLGVPNGVMSDVHDEEESVVVKAVGGPATGLPNKNFILYNFEKGPVVALPGQPYGFIFDQCGREEAAYLSDYMNDTLILWDTIPSNLLKWARAPQSITHKEFLREEPVYVPGFVTDSVLRMTRLQQRFHDSYSATNIDTSQPIDILFYGSSNPHRERIKLQFDQLAALLDLRVEFHLDYGAFDLERDSLVERSKIVLNLGNADWPPSREEASVYVNNSYCDIDIGVKPLGTPVNWHRIKGLLARGKVVVSERSGSPLDEELLSGVVVFADSTALTEVVVLLLYDVNLRRQIERRALSYMLQDQTRAQVVMDGVVTTSALSHLATALSKVAATMWPESVPTECTNRSPQRDVPLPTTCENDIQPSLTSDGISLQQKSLEWLECQCRSSEFTEIAHSRPLLYSSVVRTGNASSPCFRRMDTSLLIGYLVKRYNYTGLMTPWILRFIEKHTKIVCIQSANLVRQSAKSYREYIMEVLATTTTTATEFDMIIFDSSLVDYDEVRDALDVVLPRLSLRGTLLMPNICPCYHHESVNPTSAYYVGPIWKMLLCLRALPYRLAVVDIDGGLAVLQHGDNHRQLDMNSYCFSSGNAITIDPGHFAGNIDIVSGTFVHMHKLHKWLL